MGYLVLVLRDPNSRPFIWDLLKNVKQEFDFLCFSILQLCISAKCFFFSILPSKDEFLRLLDPDLLLCFTFLSSFQTFLLNLQMVVFCTHMGLIPPFFKAKKERFWFWTLVHVYSEEGFTSSTYTSHVEKCPRA